MFRERPPATGVVVLAQLEGARRPFAELSRDALHGWCGGPLTVAGRVYHLSRWVPNRDRDDVVAGVLWLREPPR